MSALQRLQRYLEEHQVDYQVHEHAEAYTARSSPRCSTWPGDAWPRW